MRILNQMLMSRLTSCPLRQFLLHVLPNSRSTLLQILSCRSELQSHTLVEPVLEILLPMILSTWMPATMFFRTTNLFEMIGLSVMKTFAWLHCCHHNFYYFQYRVLMFLRKTYSFVDTMDHLFLWITDLVQELGVVSVWSFVGNASVNSTKECEIPFF